MTVDFAYVLKHFRYDPNTGHLYWKKGKDGRQLHKPAGHADRTGYRRVMINYKMYLAHRLIWLLHYGEWPKQHIDHIDGNPGNNRLENLRDVSRSVNLRNNWKARRYELPTN